MAKYDYSKVTRDALEELASQVMDVVGQLSPHMSRRLSGAVHVVRGQALTKTRDEYDKEIGDLLREQLYDESASQPVFERDELLKLRALVNESRDAPEES